jgi:cysteinyl-tRNA synthetase
MLKTLANVLGLLQREPGEFLQSLPGASTLDPKQIDEYIAARVQARKSKNFAEADRIRKLLLDNGIVLEDTAQGTLWRRS